MKVLLVVVAIFGLSNAAVLLPERQHVHSEHLASRDLNDLLKQFIAFIPFDDCVAVVKKYIATNEDVQKAYDFLLSDEFKKLTDEVVAMPEYQNFLKYLYDAGVDIYTYQNILRKMLNLPPIEPPRLHRSTPRESGIILMIKDILKLLPIDDIKSWFYNVCLPDEAFQDLLKKLTSQEFRDLVEAVYRTKEYNELTTILKNQGIDVAAIEKVIADFISGSLLKSTEGETLKQLLDEFVAFIPIDDVLNVVLSYLSDPDVIKVLDFLQGDDFRNLVINLEGVQELKDFLNWLVSKDIPAYDYINTVLDLLGIPHIEPKKIPHFRRPSPQSGLTEMINDIINLLPIDQIIEWYHSTCEPNPEFQELLAQLRSDSFKVVVNTVTSDQAFPKMVQLLKDLDIDTDAIGNWLHNFFGW